MKELVLAMASKGRAASGSVRILRGYVLKANLVKIDEHDFVLLPSVQGVFGRGFSP